MQIIWTIIWKLNNNLFKIADCSNLRFNLNLLSYKIIETKIDTNYTGHEESNSMNMRSNLKAKFYKIPERHNLYMFLTENVLIIIRLHCDNLL